LGYFEDVTLRLEASDKKELVILIINVFEKNNRI
jgi:outer membrane protein assembly factor BamA